MFKNEDLEDCIRPISTLDIDPSIQNLRGDPNKHTFRSYRCKDEIVVSLDKLEDRTLRMELIKFFEEDNGQGWYKKINPKQL